jgi:pimeloyl-ACP methyl ester carboxylesterase
MKKYLLIFAILAIFVNASIVNSQVSQCSSPKITTLPLSGDYGGIGPYSVTRQSIVNPDPAAPGPISVFIPFNATSLTRAPVVFFAHGFGGTSYLFYETLMLQLASNGFIVVFSPYTANILSTHPTRYGQLWGGFNAAVLQYSAIMDTTRVGFAGHSYGAGALPDMTRRGVAQGWGTNGLFIFSMAPWYNWGVNPELIPATTKMIVQVYWDDETNQNAIAQNDVWNKLPQITEKKWQVVRASKTYCSLNAGHSLPVTNGLGQNDAVTNSYDNWGVWRRLHALSVYTFSGNLAAKNVAFGGDANMGRWRGIFGSRRISPLESTDLPVVNPSNTATFLWVSKCTYAQGSPCP